MSRRNFPQGNFPAHDYNALEKRQLLSISGPAKPEIFEPQLDPNVGAVVTAFIQNDAQDPNDSYDILIGWKSAVDEFVSVGMNEITFAVYRIVENGNFFGGPTNSTVRSAVQYANDNNLSVTILPVFEANGWRGEYDPTGSTRSRFQSQYRQWISDLASIPGVDRFNIGSELNRMVENPNNFSFFTSLIQTTKNAFNSIGNSAGRIGYAANFDAYNDSQHVALLTHPDIDFMGVSAYRRVINSSNAFLVSGTGQVSNNAMQQMIDNWNSELDSLANFSRSNNLPILIQEFGAVQQNYASIAPFAVNPSDFVSSSLPNRYASDALEQKALYESLLIALNGRKDVFESVTFWTWEHQASRGSRTFNLLGENGVGETFAIWPTDGGGGEFVAQFVATRSNDSIPPVEPNIVDGSLFINGTDQDDRIDVTEFNSTVVVKINNTTKSYDKSTFDTIIVQAGNGNDRVARHGLASVVVNQYGELGNDSLFGGSGTDFLFGGDGNDFLFGRSGNDYLFGGHGNDVLQGEDGDDNLIGENGDDQLVGHDGSDYISGGVGNDVLQGRNGNDNLVGGSGVDLMYGGSGRDTMNGNTGNDVLFGGTEDDTIVGHDGDDRLFGGSGADRIFGLNGNDVIYGETGFDFLRGGVGDDEHYGGTGNDDINGYVGNDWLFGGENDDTMNGHDGNDMVVGGSGDDRAFGGSGNDFVVGGQGVDIVRGIFGNDLLVGGSLTIESSRSELQTIFDVWLSSASYADRVKEIKTGNGIVSFQIPNDRTFSRIAIDDQQFDYVIGDDGLDYFWAHANEVLGRLSSEQVT